MRHEIDDIYPEKPTPIYLEGIGEAKMKQWTAAGIVLLLLGAGFGGYKALGCLEYTQKDFADISTIKGEEEVMAYEAKYCTPLNKRDRDIPTCMLWREKHRKLIVDGPEIENLANASDASEAATENPTLGDGHKKGK